MPSYGGKTVDDLRRVTGLTKTSADACFAVAGGSYAAALASFAQSYAQLRDDDFDAGGRATVTANTTTINDTLHAIYSRARALKAARQLSSDAAVWRALKDEEAEGDGKNGDGDRRGGGGGDASTSDAPASSEKTAKTHEAWAKAFEYILPSQGAPATAAAGKSTSGADTTSTAAAKPFSSIFSFGPAAGAATATAATTTTTTAAAAVTGGTSTASKPALASVFGFGAPAPSTAATGVTTSIAATTKPFSFGFAAAASPATTSVAAAVAKPAGPAPAASTTTTTAAAAAHKPSPPHYCKATHFTGPYFDMPEFWQAEVVARAPLLNLDHGFLAANKDKLRPRLLKWVARASFYKGPVRYVAIDDEDEDVVRVIIKDAERTFFAPPHRAKLVALLHAMYHEFGAYGQAMSYLAALCMLALSEEETASVLRFVATEYIKGHWAAEAVGFATSAWVVEYFLEKRAPDVAAHLQALRLWPDTYLQKILTGLCVHVLRFSELFDFLDAFMQDGMRYLTRFCLAIVEHYRSDLLAVASSQDASTVYEIMRLDARVADQHDVRAILARVDAIDLGEEGDALDVIRSRMYSEKVEPRLQRAPRTETYEPCEHCGTARPSWWHDDTGAVCTACKDACDATLVFEKY